MDKQHLQNLVLWAQNNAWVMKIGEYNPADMHALPKGKLIEIFDALEYLIGQYGTAHAVATIEPMKELNQKDKIFISLNGNGNKTLSEITKSINSKSMASTQKSLNAMIKDGIIHKHDDNTFSLKGV
jgi:hypothetical protein